MEKMLGPWRWHALSQPGRKGDFATHSVAGDGTPAFVFISETRLVLVTDLARTKQCLPGQYAEALNLWKNAPGNMLLADIHIPVDGMPSLEEVFRT
jgi:hypothetical protein